MDARGLFEILVRENERMVLAFLRGLVGESDALDLFQQTCLTAWKLIDRYDRSRPFGPWLRGIASNLVLKHFSKRRATVAFDDQAVAALELRMEQLERLPGDHWNDKLDSLRDCLARVDPDDRRLLDLYYRDGLSCAEISSRFGQGLEAVKKRLQRLRADLFRCLEGKLA